MNIADVIVIAVLLAILAVIVYATRPKKGKDSGCGIESRHKIVAAGGAGQLLCLFQPV